jgi:dynein heavy chain, axonemal
VLTPLSGIRVRRRYLYAFSLRSRVVDVNRYFQCQATWMYLEPIFSSEDIMRQMPTEARNFRDVDKEWRTIMTATQKDPLVLPATDFPGLLKKLRYSNSLLDDIQRGLNDYLEKKRLFFPRSLKVCCQVKGFFWG